MTTVFWPSCCAALWRAWLCLCAGNFMVTGRLPQVTYKPFLLQTQNAAFPPSFSNTLGCFTVLCWMQCFSCSLLSAKEKGINVILYWLHSWYQKQYIVQCPCCQSAPLTYVWLALVGPCQSAAPSLGSSGNLRLHRSQDRPLKNLHH